jgi:hypothetical protein
VVVNPDKPAAETGANTMSVLETIVGVVWPRVKAWHGSFGRGSADANHTLLHWAMNDFESAMRRWREKNNIPKEKTHATEYNAHGGHDQVRHHVG